jgi:hypothetical protein
MKLRDQHDDYIREVEIHSNSKDTVFLAFIESGQSLDDYRYYSRDFTYTQAQELIAAIQHMMRQRVKVGDTLTLDTIWDIGNGGPDTHAIPQGMDFEVTAINGDILELTCCEDDFPYNSFKIDITGDDLTDFILSAQPE